MTAEVPITRGDDYTGVRRLIVTVRDEAGALADLTGTTATFMVKRHRNDADVDALITKSLELDPDQVVHKGKAYIAIAGTDTDDLRSLPYFFEIQAVDAVGVITLATGRFVVVADLIREAP